MDTSAGDGMEAYENEFGDDAVGGINDDHGNGIGDVPGGV